MTCYCGYKYRKGEACPLCGTHRSVAWVEREVKVCFFILLAVFLLLDLYFHIDYLPYLEACWQELMGLVEAVYNSFGITMR